MHLKPLPGLIILLAIAAIPLFSHLNELPLQLYDEARVAVKALEISRGGNWLVTTVNGQPDMWSVKPPMAIWLQAIFIKLFGISELSVRLPSALAGLGTCLLLWHLFLKKLGDSLPGVITTAILCTSMGFVMLHGTRSADFDAPLTFFTTGSLVFFYRWLDEEKPWLLHWCGAFLLFAAYTKGVQGLLFSPAMLVTGIWKKKLGWMLKQPVLYLWLVLLAVLIPGYYLLREHYNPGYLQAVWENELGARYKTVIEGHQGPWYYFIDWIRVRALSTWYPALIGGLIVCPFINDKRLKDLAIYFIICTLTYGTIISSAQTKCWWYIMPVVPFMAAIAAVFIYYIVQMVTPMLASDKRKMFIVGLALTALLVRPYMAILDITLGPPPQGDLWDYLYEDMAELMRSEYRNQHLVNLDNTVVPDLEGQDNLLWYKEVLETSNP